MFDSSWAIYSIGVSTSLVHSTNQFHIPRLSFQAASLAVRRWENCALDSLDIIIQTCQAAWPVPPDPSGSELHEQSKPRQHSSKCFEVDPVSRKPWNEAIVLHEMNWMALKSKTSWCYWHTSKHVTLQKTKTKACLKLAWWQQMLLLRASIQTLDLGERPLGNWPTKKWAPGPMNPMQKKKQTILRMVGSDIHKCYVTMWRRNLSVLLLR